MEIITEMFILLDLRIYLIKFSFRLMKRRRQTSISRSMVMIENARLLLSDPRQGLKDIYFTSSKHKDSSYFKLSVLNIFHFDVRYGVYLPFPNPK